MFRNCNYAVYSCMITKHNYELCSIGNYEYIVYMAGEKLLFCIITDYGQNVITVQTW